MKLHLLVLILSLLIVPFLAPLSSNADDSKKILFLGDSLTAGYGVPEEMAFPSLVMSKIKKDKPNVTFVNASISGSTTAGAQGRLKWQLKAKPDILFLALGANDGLRGFDPKTTEENLRNTIQLAKDKGIQVILAGMQMPPNYGEEYRQKFASIYPKLEKELNVIFIPFLLKGVGGVKELNQEDGIHPNEAGHKIIAETVFPYIKEAL